MREEADEFLVSRGAAGLPHSGGTLLEHSRRVADLLHRWGAPRDWQLAALCHACYGTAGYGHALIDPTDRETLRSLIGVDAERIVSCTAAVTAVGSIPSSPSPGRSRLSTGSPATCSSRERRIYAPSSRSRR